MDYLNAAAKTWGAFVEVDNQTYLAALPVPYKKWGGMRVVRHTNFLQYLGPIGLEEYHQPLIAELKNQFKFIVNYRIRPGVQVEAAQQLPTHYLYMRKSKDELLANFAPINHRLLKVAQKAQWTIEQSLDFSEIIPLFLHNKPVALRKTHPATLRHLEAICVANATNTEIYQARLNGNLEAAAVFWRYQNQLIYQFSTFSIIGKKHQGPLQLMFEVIMQNAGSDVLLDFETTNTPAHISWNASFGSETVQYSQITKVPVWFKALMKLRQWFY